MSLKVTEFEIKVLVLSGGKLPVQGKPGFDVGFDAFVRTIAGRGINPSTRERDIIWDFTSKPHSSLRSITTYEDGVGAYILQPGKTVLVGLGVIFGMNNDWFSQLQPRHSFSEDELELVIGDVKCNTNYVPVDPGFRAEVCGRILNSSDKPFLIKKHWRPAQFVFYTNIIPGQLTGFFRPKLVEAKNLAELGLGTRGVNCNGSSGKNGNPVDANQLTLF